MTRPITWAIGVFGGVAVAATVAGDRLAKATAARERAGVMTVARPDAPPPRAGEVIVLPDRAGHYSVDTAVDGEFMRMMVDTGATTVALREEDARRAGIRLGRSDFVGRSRTANGVVEVAPVRLRSLRVGGIEMRDVDAVIIPAGRLGTNLLGMSFLKRLRGFDITGGRLVLRG